MEKENKEKITNKKTDVCFIVNCFDCDRNKIQMQIQRRYLGKSRRFGHLKQFIEALTNEFIYIYNVAYNEK